MFKRNRGFSLMELAVVMTIAAILVAIAYSGYASMVTKSRRTQAIALLVGIAGKQEQFYAEHGVYTNDLTKLGYKVSQALLTENGYYEISAVTPSNQEFRLIAKRLQQQVRDTRCGDLTLDQVGVRGAVNNEEQSAAENCWE